MNNNFPNKITRTLARALAVAVFAASVGGFLGAGGYGGADGFGAAYAADVSPTADHMIRVHLSSLGSPSSIKAGIAGSYTIKSNGKAVSGTVTIAAKGSSGIKLTAGGTAYSLGKDIILKAASQNVSNRITLGGDDYPGDLRVINKSGKLKLVSHVDMETYVMGVVPYEVGDSKEYMEALKANAVAARTFAYFFVNSSNRASQEHDIVNTTAAQVYKGYDASYKNANAAASATACQILTTPSGGEVLTCYSASNGGHTEYPKSAGATASNFKYLPYKKDSYDLKYSLAHSSYSATVTIPKSLKASDLKNSGKQPYAMLREAMKAAGVNPSDLTSGSKVSVKEISLTNPRYSDNKTPRAYTGADFTLGLPKMGSVAARDIVVKFAPYVDDGGTKRPFLNSKLGLANKSKFSMLYLRNDDSSYLLAAVRYGHSAGMSQVGSYQMAKEGKKYKTILKFYYLMGSQTKLVTKEWPIDNGVTAGPVPSGADSSAEKKTKKTAYPFKAKVKITSGTLTVRSGPGTKYKKLGSLKKNSKITVKGAKSSWYRITFKGKKAYVAKRYIKKI
ncbi:MAG: SpoIID/LytB domain-containing protein [Clostridiales Family XIII bacterium]|jgi:SpoIID/LytB domain protein|nr:SpoIID/LytB domain-containing protein [Clostridiales Family XIII bacterium]